MFISSVLRLIVSLLFILVLLTISGCGANFISVDGESTCEQMIKKYEKWSTSGFLATGGGVGTTPNGGSTSQELSLQVDFVQNGPGAGYYTVQFDLGQTPLGGASAVAEITWSVSGNDVTRVIDVVDGAVISGTAEAVKVVVRDRTSPNIYTPGQVYSVDIMVAPGCRPSQNQPPRYSPDSDLEIPGLFTVASAATQDIDVPKDVGVISVFVNAVRVGPPLVPVSVPGEASVIFFINFGTPIAIGGFDIEDGIGRWIALPPNTEVVRLQNTTGGGGATDINFNVMFGIEG